MPDHDDHTELELQRLHLRYIDRFLTVIGGIVLAASLAFMNYGLRSLEKAQSLRTESDAQLQQSVAKISAAVETNSRAIALLTKISEENSAALGGR
jgi:hypothetical protein